VPARDPTILALDFDGVICDGMREYFVAAWRAWRRLRPSVAPDPPRGLFDRFARARPVVETGWEMPLVIMALLAGVPEGDILERWRPDALLGDLGQTRDEITAALDRVRDEWIAADEGDWLDHHRFYPGAIERLRRLAGGPTRRRRDNEGGQVRAKALGPSGGRSRRQGRLRQGSAAVEARDSPRRLWFVEDRLKTLDAVKRTPALDDVGLFLAGWGYNTAADHEAARRDSRIVLLSLEKFGGDFPTWVEA